MVCDKVKNSLAWKMEEWNFQLRAESLQIPGFLVKVGIDSLNGVHKSIKRQPEHRSWIFREHNLIGWENFAKGRVGADWYKYRKQRERGKQMGTEEWQLKLSETVLELLGKK